MATKVSIRKCLNQASGIGKVWKDSPEIKLGKVSENVTFTTYQDSIARLEALNEQIADARHELKRLQDHRADAARLVNRYNTRALSAICGVFGPDSSEYDLAGGTRTSDRKSPTRTTKTPPPA